MTINPLDPITTFPRSLLESSREQNRLDRPLIEQDQLINEDLKKREHAQKMPPTLEKTQEKILRQREREERDERAGEEEERKEEREKWEEEEREKEREKERDRISSETHEPGSILDRRI